MKLLATLVATLVSGVAFAASAVITMDDHPWYNPASYSNLTVTEGYAPFAVFFDGSGSTPRDGSATWTWDFDDGTTATGMNVGHVYDEPGTYDVVLTVDDGTPDTDTVTITVNARDGTTYYVDSAVGNDGNAGTSESAPWKTATKVFQAIQATTFGPGDAVLFRRGQTFDVGATPTIGHGQSGYGYYLGAFGEGQKPIIQTIDGPTDAVMFQQGNGLVHFGMQDLEFRLTSPGGDERNSLLEVREKAHNIFLSRVDIKGGFQWLSFNGAPGSTSTGVSNVVVDHCTGYDAGWVATYCRAYRVAFMDNHFDLAGNHIGYYAWVDKGAWVNNIYTRPAWGRTALRLSSNAGSFSTPSNNVYIGDNYFGGWVDPTADGSAQHGAGGRYNYTLVEIAPNASGTQSIEDSVFQNNFVTNAEKMLSIGNAEDIIVKGNTFVSPDTYASARVAIGAHSYATRPCVNITFTGNTIWSNQGRTAHPAIMQFDTYSGPAYGSYTEHQNIIVSGNFFYAQKGNDPVYWFEAFPASLQAQMTFGANSYYIDDDSALFQVGGTYNSAGTNYSLATFQSTYSKDFGSTVLAASDKPYPGQAISPTKVSVPDIEVSFDDVLDVDGTGIDNAYLWVKKDAGAWTNTGQGVSDTSGAFNYTPASDGTYLFATSSESVSGQTSIVPASRLTTQSIVYGLSLTLPAATDVTPTQSGYFTKSVFEWTSDASGDAVAVTTANTPGILYSVATIPSTSAAPTDNYDVVIYQQFEDIDGNDVVVTTDLANSGLLNRDTANTEIVNVWPSETPRIHGKLRIVVSNAGNAKSGTVEVYTYNTLSIQQAGPSSGAGIPLGGTSPQMLQYSSSGVAKWISISGDISIADGGAVAVTNDSHSHTAATIDLALADLSDVSDTGPSSGQVLAWDGAEWAPAAAGSGGLALGDDEYATYGDDTDFKVGYDSSAGKLAWKDTANNALVTLADAGTTGVLAVAGNVSATGQLVSTVSTGTAPLSVSSTTAVSNLNASLLLGGTWAAPGAIGSGTPAAGAFTTLSASSTSTLAAMTATTGSFSSTLGVTGAVTVTGGSIAAGVDDTTSGIFTAYGNSANSGGFIQFYTGASQDNDVERWLLGADTGGTGNFRLRTVGGTASTEDVFWVQAATSRNAFFRYDLGVNGGDLLTTAPSATLYPSNATAIQLGGASATTTVPGAMALNGDITFGDASTDTYLFAGRLVPRDVNDADMSGVPGTTGEVVRNTADSPDQLYFCTVGSGTSATWVNAGTAQAAAVSDAGSVSPSWDDATARADFVDLWTRFNDLLAKLRSAGLVASS